MSLRSLLHSFIDDRFDPVFLADWILQQRHITISTDVTRASPQQEVLMDIARASDIYELVGRIIASFMVYGQTIYFTSVESRNGNIFEAGVFRYLDKIVVVMVWEKASGSITMTIDVYDRPGKTRTGDEGRNSAVVSILDSVRKVFDRIKRLAKSGGDDER